MKIEEFSIETKKRKDVVNFINSGKNEVFTVLEIVQSLWKTNR